jgi:hypothetical protein
LRTASAICRWSSTERRTISVCSMARGCSLTPYKIHGKLPCRSKSAGQVFAVAPSRAKLHWYQMAVRGVR